MGITYLLDCYFNLLMVAVRCSIPKKLHKSEGLLINDGFKASQNRTTEGPLKQVSFVISMARMAGICTICIILLILILYVRAARWL